MAKLNRVKTYTIYRHINNINGKSYIGITCQALTNRWKSGKGYTKANQPVFYNAIKKYGWWNFSHEILETNIATLEEANKREQYWIAFYHSWIYDPECSGYNNTKGGDGTGGHKLKEESKRYLKVYCLELNQTFNSLTEAAKNTSAQISKISECCNGKRDTAGGYHWSFIDLARKQAGDNAKQLRISNRRIGPHKKVSCLINGNKYIFESIKQAAVWWFNNYKPCGNNYDKAVLYSKIRDSIMGLPIYTGKNQYTMQEITNIKWFLED